MRKYSMYNYILLVHIEAAVARNIYSNILAMAWACVYAAVLASLIIYFITWYTIDRRERVTSYTGGYFNISDNS
jgi:hypothetical protein